MYAFAHPVKLFLLLFLFILLSIFTCSSGSITKIAIFFVVNASKKLPIAKHFFVVLFREVTKIVYFIGNEHMLIAHDSNRLRFS